MSARGVTQRDLRHALQHAKRCTSERSSERLRVTGADLDGDELTVIVVVEDGLVVVTLF